MRLPELEIGVLLRSKKQLGS